MSNTTNKIKVGLEAVNIQDKEHLRHALLTCEDPIKAISDFQEENSIMLPTLKPALNLLDLHNVRRHDFHASIADELKEQLIKRIEDLVASVQKEPNGEDAKKLEDLLDRSFPLICMPRLTNLILLIMKSLPKINESYLGYLNENEQLYSLASIEVKRQIWTYSSNVFNRELKPHFEKFLTYFDDIITKFEIVPGTTHSFASLNITQIDSPSPVIKDLLLLSNTFYTNFFRKNNRYTHFITDIAKLIGTSNKLYQHTINLIHSKYIKNNNWLYSTLKNQLLVKLGEMHNHDIFHSIVTQNGNDEKTNENLLKFASIVNACLKEKKIDNKKAKEMESIMDSKKFEKIIADVAFILADPFVIDMLARNAISFLNRSIQNELLPRNCTELIFVLRLLALGLRAKELMENKSKEPKMDSMLITVFLPNLAYFLTDFCEKVYDDSFESLTNPTTNVNTNSLLLTATSPTLPIPTTTQTTPTIQTKKDCDPPKISSKKIPIVQSIKQQMDQSELSCTLLIYLVIACFEINDWINLKILLPEIKFPSSKSEQFQKWFLYQFFNILNEKSVLEQFKHEWFVKLIFDDFLLQILKQKANQINDFVIFYEQIIKLVDKLCPNYLSPLHTTSILNEIKPNESHPSSLHVNYLKLKQKVGAGSERNVDELL